MREKLRVAHDPDTASSSRSRLARLYLQAGEPEKAIYLYRYGIIVEPDRSSRYHREIGDIYKGMERDDLAAVEYELAETTRRPGNESRVRKQLETWEEEGQDELILQQYLFLLWTRPGSRDLYLHKVARLLMSRGKKDEALRYYRWLVENHRERVRESPDRAFDYSLRIAKLYKEMGEMEAAEREYDQAVKIEGEEGGEALIKKAAFHDSQGGRAIALALYRKAETRKEVDLVAIRLKIAGLLEEEGDVAGALSWMEKAGAAGGEDGARGRLKIARYLLRHDRPEKALAAYREVLPELSLKDQARSMERMGKILADLGRDEEATNAYLAAIDLWREAIGPEAPGPTLLERLADLAKKAARPEIAGEYYEKLIVAYRARLNEEPARAEYYHRKLGDLYRALERYTEAAAHYRTWSRIKPEDPGPHYRLYRLYRDYFDNKEIADYYRARYRELREREKGKSREEQGVARNGRDEQG